MTDVIVIPEGEHSDRGPSSSERWLNCPGSTGQGQTEYAAEGRGISWELTFEQWVDWWGQDLHQRGVKSQEFCMGRKGDTGPYSLDNIKKITTRQNIMEGLLKNS